MRKLLSSLLCLGPCLLTFAACANACSPQGAESLAVMSYNVENLFDTADDGGEYPEFSVAMGKWDEARYKARLERLAAVVLAAAPEKKGPDILCLVEVENRGVLEELRTGALKASGYVASALAPAPGQAVNCGILSRFPIEETKAHAITTGSRQGRYILEAEIGIGSRRLAVFVCHWKSKLEGAEETEAERVAAASLLVDLVSRILEADPGEEFLVCGDFNENPDEYERVGRRYPTAFMPASLRGSEEASSLCEPCLFVAGEEGEAGLTGGRLSLYSPWFAAGTAGGSAAGDVDYSYVMKGEKERIDGFLLSPGLLDEEGLSFASFSPLAADFLLDAKGVPLSYQPSRGSGYSDHLPIILGLSVSGEPSSSPRRRRPRSPGSCGRTRPVRGASGRGGSIRRRARCRGSGGRAFLR